MNTRILKKYIENIFKLEISLHSQSQLYNNIDTVIKDLERYDGEPLYSSKSKYKFSSYPLFDEGIGNAFWGMLGSAFICGIICGIIVWLLNLFHIVVLDNFWGSIIHALIIGACVGFILPILITLIQYIVDIHKISAENNEIALKNDELRQLSTEKRKIINIRIQILNGELEEISSSYYKTKDILDDYYNMNIIYPKYRNLIAVSSFNEYFSSGRCSELKGHEGAYNIYENELRLDKINDKLDDILDNLESIKQNQYMLYSAIQNCSNMVQEIANQTFEAAVHLQNIENNTVVTSYNSAITAQNTEFLKWMKIFNK
jgi:hypothetical protein